MKIPAQIETVADTAVALPALNQRASEWKPADPDRLALGLKLAREGKAVSAAARAWFHPVQPDVVILVREQN